MTSSRIDWRPVMAAWLISTVFLLARLPEGGALSLPGSDDMMRLQQIRDLLAGQAWFDVSQSRLVTPEGGAMHWSRIPDLIPALIILILKPLLGQATAEMAAYTAWPLLLFGALAAALVALMRRLGIGTAGCVAGILAVALSSAAYQFWPGRLDHHGVVAVLVIAALAAMLHPERPVRGGLLAGIGVAAMLSIAIESLPFAAGIAAAGGLLWIVEPKAQQARLAVFGAALAVTGAVLFAIDAPGIEAARSTCDAFGIGHLIGLVAGGGGLVLLACATAYLKTVWIRGAAAVVAGAAVLALALIVAPNCIGNPYADLTPELKANWLDTIGEAQSIFIVMQEKPAQAIVHFGFVLMGLITGAIAIAKSAGQARLNWTIMVILLVGAAALTAWQARGVMFAHIFAALPVSWAIGRLFEDYREAGGVPTLLKLALGIAALMPVSWTLLAGTLPAVTAQADGGNCADRAVFAALNTHEPGRVMAPVDLGSPLIAATHHSAFAAPYHRNPEGIAAVINIFLGTAEAAAGEMGRLGADYVLYCVNGPEVRRFAENAPDGFAAELNAGRVPDWLQPLESNTDSGGGLTFYRVVK